MSKNINTGLIINPLSGDTNALDVVGNQSISGNLTQTDASAETSLANGDIYIDSVAAAGIPAIWLGQTGAKTLTNASFWQTGTLQGHSVATGGQFQFRINDQASQGMTLKEPNGNVHAAYLNVGNTSLTNKYISLGGGQYGLGIRSGALGINTLSTGKIFFSGYDGSTTPTDLMTINAVNGNVGIGTSTPTESLEVVGNSKISGTLNLGNIGSGTSLTNLGWDSSGNVVSGTTGGSSDGNGIYDGSGSLTTGTTIASGGYDLNITGTGKFGVSGDIQFLSTAALESDTIKIVQSTGTTGTTGGIITFDGQTGGLFAITDDKDGQLFGVADVSGNDIMYADADWLIKMGNPFQLSGSPFELKYDNVLGNTTLSTNAINVNLNVQNITSTGVTSNIDVTKSIIKISTTTSADLLTLPDGVEGQVISIIYVAETAGADDVTITPTNLLGYTTIFLTLIGTGCELYFTDGSWVVKSQNNVTLS